MSELSRRSLITGLISLVAAPAIVRVSSLMPVKALEPQMRYTAFPPAEVWPEIEDLLKQRVDLAYKILRRDIIANMELALYRSTDSDLLNGLLG